MNNRWEDQEKALSEWMHKCKQLHGEIDRLIAENKAQAERIVKLIQLVRDMNKNIYGLYWKDTLCCHGTWPNYPHIPELLKRIKQALKGGAKE